MARIKFSPLSFFLRIPLSVIALSVFCSAQANVQGRWTTLPYTMPINPLHAALLNSGKVLVVSGSGGNQTTTTYRAALWDPQANTITTQLVSFDMFCNGMTIMPDGRPLIDGGTIQYNPSFLGSAEAAVFDPVTETFTSLPRMAHGRWYPTLQTLPDGTIMTVSGRMEVSGTNLNIEIFSPHTSSWSQQYKMPWTPPFYPRLHVLPNGNVFYSGWTPQSRYYFPATHSWSGVIATTNYTSNRTYGTSVLLPLTPANNYKPQVMIMGGNNPSTATTELIDLSAPTPLWQWGPNMSQPRIQMNAVMLPNGKILAVGGSASDEKATTASLKADLYDPATNTFSSAGANTYPRLYHSVALLLPDGTVWLAGSNPSGTTYEAHMEVYQPSYLFTTDNNGNAVSALRPVISSAPATIGYGSIFTVQTPNAADITSVVLVKTGAVTHAFNMDQRLVGLSYTADAGDLTITGPPNANIAPPGYYMLFLLNSAGVPSVASFVQVASGPDFSVNVSPAQNVTTPGAVLAYTVQTTPSADYTGPINLSLSGVPAGITATLGASSLPERGSTTLNLDTSALKPPSLPVTYPITITGAGGSMSRSATISLLVNSPGDFSAATSASSLTVTRGSKAPIAINISGVSGFVGVVNFAVGGLPGKVTATYSPTTVTGSGTTTLTVSAGVTATAGTSKVTVTATSGTLVHTATFSLIIQ